MWVQNTSDLLDVGIYAMKVLAKDMPRERHRTPREIYMVIKTVTRGLQSARQVHPKSTQEAILWRPRSTKIGIGGTMGTPRKTKREIEVKR